jgi:hypothetical protein
MAARLDPISELFEALFDENIIGAHPWDPQPSVALMQARGFGTVKYAMGTDVSLAFENTVICLTVGHAKRSGYRTRDYFRIVKRVARRIDGITVTPVAGGETREHCIVLEISPSRLEDWRVLAAMRMSPHIPASTLHMLRAMGLRRGMQITVPQHILARDAAELAAERDNNNQIVLAPGGTTSPGGTP